MVCIVTVVESFIVTPENEKIVQGLLKVSNHPNVKLMSLILRENLDQGLAWVIRHLKLAGVCDIDLIALYKVLVWPIHVSSIYHPILTLTQANELEKLQKMVLKSIYGLHVS